MLAQSLDSTFLGLADELNYELDIYDFTPRTNSAFASLLLERENMKAWNEFINASEDEQAVILQMGSDDEDEMGWVTVGGSKRGGKRNKRKPRSNSSGDLLDEESARKAHPAFCPQRSFERLDNAMKSLLRRKHIPAVSIPLGRVALIRCLESRGLSCP